MDAHIPAITIVHVRGWSDLIDVNSKGWSGLLSSRSEFAARALISLGSESLLCFRGTWDYLLHPRADRVVMALRLNLPVSACACLWQALVCSSPTRPWVRRRVARSSGSVSLGRLVCAVMTCVRKIKGALANTNRCGCRSVADAAYCAPYVLAFSDRFYEVRHVETKEVVSIVPFNNFVHLSTHNDLNSGEILIAVRAILDAVLDSTALR